MRRQQVQQQPSQSVPGRGVPPPDFCPPEFCFIPLGRLLPSMSNVRKRFDEAELKELAQSIRDKGILEPLLVRPMPGGGVVPAYEIVAGHRRHRAAKIAGLAEVPALVRPYTDREALEVQVIENEQRADTSPLEKAEGYHRLIQEHNASVEQIAERVGKSISTIRNLLKLRALPDIARRALDAGLLPPSTAQLIARVPSDEAREEFACRVLCQETEGWNKAPGLKAAQKAIEEGREPASFRDAKECVEELYMVELKDAPFDRKALDLVRNAGSCDDCPKLTGNNPDEYPHARADVCTDPTCYRRKCEAHAGQVVRKARALGIPVLEGKDAAKVMNGGNVVYEAPYINLASRCYEDPKQRTYEKILTNGTAAACGLTVVVDGDKNVHQLVNKPAAMKALKKLGIGKRASSGGDGNDAWRRQQAKQRAEDLLKKEAARRCMGLVAEKAEAIADTLVTGETAAGRDYARLVELLRHLAYGAVSRSWDDVSRQVKKRRGLEAESSGHSGGNRDVLEKHIEGLDGPQLLALMAELVAGQKLLSYSPGNDAKRLWAFFGIDPKKIEQKVRAEATEKDKKGGKKPVGVGVEEDE